MTDDQTAKLIKAAGNLVSILDAIVQMSDDVKRGVSPLDQQGKLLKLQNSIQKNTTRILPHIQVVVNLLPKADQAKETA